jgi:hypothetical protein
MVPRVDLANEFVLADNTFASQREERLVAQQHVARRGGGRTTTGAA